jgi:hypothetical protein
VRTGSFTPRSRFQIWYGTSLFGTRHWPVLRRHVSGRGEFASLPGREVEIGRVLFQSAPRREDGHLVEILIRPVAEPRVDAFHVLRRPRVFLRLRSTIAEVLARHRVRIQVEVKLIGA